MLLKPDKYVKVVVSFEFLAIIVLLTNKIKQVLRWTWASTIHLDGNIIVNRQGKHFIDSKKGVRVVAEGNDQHKGKVS